MDQINSFKVLGATPNDTIEKLQDLLGEKELLLDDATVAQNAYNSLINPKKRLIQEICYYCDDVFLDIHKVVFGLFEETLTRTKVAEVLVKLGKWFDTDHSALLSQIDESRTKSGFRAVGDSKTIVVAINELRYDCLQSVNKYLSGIKEESLIAVFNNIVKLQDYGSFFIDELIAHYEIGIGKTLQLYEENSMNAFSTIEGICKDIIDGRILDRDIKNEIVVFEESIKKWDQVVQPLQVNAQRHGGQHEGSEMLLHSIRNSIIALCNSSQEKLGSLFKKLESSTDYFVLSDTRTKIRAIAPGMLHLTENLIRIIDILRSVFSELDISLERLNKDKNDLLSIKTTLQKIVPVTPTLGNNSSPFRPSKGKSNGDRVGYAILFFLALGLMILFYVFKIWELGIACTFFTITFAACFLAFDKLSKKRAIKWIVIGTLILSLIVGIPVGISRSNSLSQSESSYSTTTSTSTTSGDYVVTLNKDGGSGGTSSVYVSKGDSMPSATAPTRSGYTFKGYYTSRNGKGTKYYDENMSSSRKYDKTTSATLYAFWEKDDAIVLTKSNFEDYFTFTSSCSVSWSTSAYLTSGTATYNYSIAPKSSFNKSDSRNPSKIVVVIAIDFSSSKYAYGTPSQNKTTVTLYKSNGYKYSGTKKISVTSSQSYWNDGIYSVTGTIYD